MLKQGFFFKKNPVITDVLACWSTVASRFRWKLFRWKVHRKTARRKPLAVNGLLHLKATEAAWRAHRKQYRFTGQINTTITNTDFGGVLQALILLLPVVGRTSDFLKLYLVLLWYETFRLFFVFDFFSTPQRFVHGVYSAHTYTLQHCPAVYARNMFNICFSLYSIFIIDINIT